MRIEFEQKGGIAYFPGLSKPVTIDVDSLDAEEVEELKRLVKSARFFDLPKATKSPTRGAADSQRYVLSIEDGERRHTVWIHVPIEDQALLNLVHAVQKQVKAARSVDRKPSTDPEAGRRSC